MAGNHDGGVKARDTNYANRGKDFYKKIGSIGGKLGHTGGFWADRELARRAGAIGGKISKRKKVEIDQRMWELYASWCENEGTKPTVRDFVIWVKERYGE